MPIDGVVVRNIIHELDDNILNGRIDKISQPEVDEIILDIRGQKGNFKLLLSSSPNFPRLHLTKVHKKNPISAPMFCMVLRKHLSGGRIVGLEQFNLDRLVKIHIECYDELGVLSTKVIVIEIMGRHSNIILLNSSGEILDSIKHVTLDMSSYRQVLPGIPYKYPPAQDRINPLSFTEGSFLERLQSSTGTERLDKYISQVLEGVSLFASREICHQAGLDEKLKLEQVDSSSRIKLLSSVKIFTERITKSSFSPCIYYTGESPHDFYSFKLEYLKHLDNKSIDSISDTIESFYRDKDKQDRIRQKSSDISRVVSNNLERCYKKLSIQEETLLQCKDKDKWKLYGDLITSNLYSITEGSSRVEVVNYFTENMETVTLELDSSLTPVKNAQKYYKKYNKEKAAEIATEEQKKSNLEEIQYLENQQINISNCTEDNEIDEIRNELILLGYIKKGKKTASRKQAQSKPMHYVTDEGIDIYVGKNNVQNDYLTIKFAESNDIWMHTKNIPGSHVIIKAKGKVVDENVILTAANLSAFYSKAKNSSGVPVDYTERKYVKKPSGSKPGMVIYYTNKTVYVTPDEDKIRKLKQEQ